MNKNWSRKFLLLLTSVQGSDAAQNLLHHVTSLDKLDSVKPLIETVPGNAPPRRLK